MGFLLQLFTGFFTGPLSAISKDIKEAYQSKLNAANDKERIAADERIALLEARKSIIVSGQANPMERWVRAAFAVPFIFYVWKCVMWDKILGWGVTDALGSQFDNLMWVVVGGFFVDYTVTKVVRTVKGK